MANIIDQQNELICCFNLLAEMFTFVRFTYLINVIQCHRYIVRKEVTPTTNQDFILLLKIYTPE